jgi:hypothetical protein
LAGWHQSLAVKDRLDQMRAHFGSLHAEAEALTRADGHQDPRTIARKVEEFDRSRSSLVNHILRAAIARRVTVETQPQSEQPPK